jgi:hypothetical protein
MVCPRREPAKGWPLNRESHRICDPITLDAVWYRQFSGASRLARGREEFSLRILPLPLILMGDWCGPNRHRLKRKQGRVLRDHGSRELKKGNKKIPTGMSVPLDLPSPK